MSMEESFSLLIEESRTVVEHTIDTIYKIFKEEEADTGKKVKIDGESFLDICTHLSIVYHMLVTSVAEAIVDGKDINTSTQRVLAAVKNLSAKNKHYISPSEIAKAQYLVDSIFARTKGSA